MPNSVRGFLFLAIACLASVLSSPSYSQVAKINPVDAGQVWREDYYTGTSNTYLFSVANGNMNAFGVEINFDPNFRYSGTNIDYRAFVQFETSNLTSAGHFYLVLSPSGQYMGIPITPSVNIRSYPGTGTVQVSDYSAGTPIGSAPINQIDGNNWYTPDSFGGMLGDTRIDVSSIVGSALSNGQLYLGFGLQATLATSNTIGGLFAGVTFRNPYLLYSANEIPAATLGPVIAVAEPNSLGMLLAGIAFVGFAVGRKRSTGMASV